MMHRSERDPIQSIVDIDSFAGFMIGFRAEIFRSRLKPEELFELDAEGIYRRRQGANMDVPPNLQTRGEEGSGVMLVENYPWDDVPESLRNLLVKHFKGAEQDESKGVSLSILGNEIGLKVNSASIVGNLDAFAERSVSPIRLSFTGTGEGEKGFWRVAEGPPQLPIINPFAFLADELLAGREITDEVKEYFVDAIKNRGRENVKRDYFPCEVPQLQAIARILLRSRDNVRVFNTGSITG